MKGLALRAAASPGEAQPGPARPRPPGSLSKPSATTPRLAARREDQKEGRIKRRDHHFMWHLNPKRCPEINSARASADAGTADS